MIKKKKLTTTTIIIIVINILHKMPEKINVIRKLSTNNFSRRYEWYLLTINFNFIIMTCIWN